MFRSRAALGLVAALVLIALAFVLNVNVRQGMGHEGADDAVTPRVVPDDAVVLFVQFGKETPQQNTWTGEVRVSPGKVVQLAVDRGAPKSTIDGTKFEIRSAKKQVTGKAAKKAAKKKAAGKTAGKKNADKKAAGETWEPPILKITLDAKPQAEVKITTDKGEIAFNVADVSIGSKQPYLDGRVLVERKELAMPLTGKNTEDDFPVTAKSADGTVWMAYVEYQPGEELVFPRVEAGAFDLLVPKGNGDRVRLMRYDGKQWSEPMNVTETGLDVWRPAIAVDGRGIVNIVWSQKLDGDWNLFARQYDPGKQGDAAWSATKQLTRFPGSDLHVAATTDSSGKAWVVWQSWRKDNYEIVLSPLAADGTLANPEVVSRSAANDWNPSIAADKRGNVYVVWDTYDRNNYDVQMHVAGVTPQTRTVADTPKFEGRACVMCDADGRPWVAYEEGDEQWGKDYSNTNEYEKIGFKDNPGYALYINRTIRIKTLVDGTWKEPASELQAALSEPLPRGRSVPRLALDGKGGMWVALRHHLNDTGNGEAWQSYLLRYDGDEWSKVQALPGSENLMDNRPALLATDRGLLCVYIGDDRRRTQDRTQSDLFATVLPTEKVDASMEFEETPAAAQAELKTVHPNEKKDIARMRAHRVTVGGKTLQLYRGEFHRHTEYSAHRDADGLLEDSLRYAHDAGDLDWMGNGDHDNGLGHEYLWWLVQKMFDIHTNTPHFMGAMTYERSCTYPNGHRNVMMPRRGIRPLPRGDLKSGDEKTGTPDTKMLYAYLKHFNAMCSSHTSGTNMGTDWRDNDPEVEPVVEIYQGHRHNYEHFGAPRSATAETQIGGYQPAGFIWNALERGYRLGFQSSSDHISTHISYGIALAPELTRPAIIEAFKARHSYAATDNIILVVTSGEHMMGDIFTTKKPPTLSIEVQGTAPIAKLHVVRDNKYIYSVEAGDDPTPNMKRTYTDTQAEPGKTSYYYVRIEQADGNLAWASPMWITYEK